MEESLKGTVTSLASLFSAEEAQNAAKRVEEAIAEKQKALDQLHHFISDNNNHIKLVQRLPDELSHDIMVPFGKAAFFPGRLIHTNEFLVLLGEGYYAERTSKQTVNILQRRGKLLNSQVDSLKAVMLDLKAEASFFDTAAMEATEGFLEIRENYIEEPTSERVSNLAVSAKSSMLGSSEEANMKVVEDDEEYARIMAKLDDLEREELAAESVDVGEEDEHAKANTGCSISQDNFDRSLKMSELGDLEDQHMPKGEALLEKQIAETEKPLLHPQSREKAFTGSIVEHTHGLHQSTTSSQSVEAAPSKRVSRFKMQKGGR